MRCEKWCALNCDHQFNKIAKKLLSWPKHRKTFNFFLKVGGTLKLQWRLRIATSTRIEKLAPTYPPKELLLRRVAIHTGILFRSCRYRACRSWHFRPQSSYWKLKQFASHLCNFRAKGFSIFGLFSTKNSHLIARVCESRFFVTLSKNKIAKFKKMIVSTWKVTSNFFD